MKIEIEIPDWCNSENLYLISRNELIAKKLVNEEWRIKIVRCNQCGRCCEIHPKEGAYYPLKEDGSCINLILDGENKICKLGMEKSLACVLGEPEGQEYKQFNCCIEYK